MKVIIACEFSGVVRDAFIARGHDAISCDLLPSERPGPHIQGDIREIDLSSFHLMIAHPPCTYIATSGNQWLNRDSLTLTVSERLQEQEKALLFVQWLLDAPVPRIAIENPRGIIGTRLHRPVTQIIHPWQFGHGEKKETCLWLKNLPRLHPTNIVSGRDDRIWRSITKKNRGYERSRTYQGIAEAMADQWGNLPACNIQANGQLSYL